MHSDFDLTQIALVALMTLGLGVFLERLRQPAVLGYILAGIILGPSLLGLIENREHVSILAEMGVLMLLFLVGMELDLKDFKQSWHISLSATGLQIAITLLTVYGLSYIFHFSLGLTVLLGFSVALSSTAVSVKMLEGIGELRSKTGRLTIGVLIAQDLAIVPMILILRSMESQTFDVTIIGKILLSVGLLAAVIILLGKRQNLILPFSSIISGQKELLPLLSLGFCFGLASIAGLAGLSAAYGAFLAGLILGNTASRDSLMKATHPIQSILMMVFFLSIGLLMDLSFIWENLWKVTFFLLIITVGKSCLNIGTLKLLGQPWRISFLSGLLLSQMGEFAFLLTTIGSDAQLIDENGQRLVISLAALSLAFSPLWLAGARRLIALKPKDTTSFQVLLKTAYGKEIRSLKRVTQDCFQATQNGFEIIKEKISKKPNKAKEEKNEK